MTILKHCFCLLQGIEIFCKEGAPCSHIYLSLPTSDERDELYGTILDQKGTHFPNSWVLLIICMVLMTIHLVVHGLHRF